MSKRIAIIGSTGSIGRQALELLPGLPGLTPCALGAGNNGPLLAEQARAHRPEAVGLAEETSAEALRAGLPDGTNVLLGPEAMAELIRRTRPDIVLVAVVGSAGLASTLATIECGATLALANKESLVCAGEIVISSARKAGVAVLPVDSEHAGIFQCLHAGKRKDVRRVILTSSGGALRDWDDARAAEARVEEALAHPTWCMGAKITIDSATLMNKALEVIEAHWLFDLAAEQIEVVLHPQSIVHAMVEFCDGSIVAQLARPDMKGPIAYALSYPDRPPGRMVEPLDFAALGRLDFRPLTGRFARAVDLAQEAIRRGGSAGAVLSAANEAAVEAFLAGRIRFGRIVPSVEQVLAHAERREDFPNLPALERLLAADAWARSEVETLLAENE